MNKATHPLKELEILLSSGVGFLDSQDGGADAACCCLREAAESGARHEGEPRMNWGRVPFIDYLDAVDDRLERAYGITSNDTNMDMIAGCQEAGMSPALCAEQIAEKYDLTMGV